ncbi:hypothetical protein BDN71DRAFT_1405711, partial [Pleurotus eryngii]
DSGADITLMSEDFLGTITEPPKIREGVCMQLYQLMGSAKVLGYVRTKLLVRTVMGKAVIFELEAYIVQGMQVLLLLGEDFQTTYELGVQRKAMGQCEVAPLDRLYQLRTSSSDNMDIGFRAHKAFTRQSFLKGKHRVRSQRQLKGPSIEAPPVLACDTVHISLGCVFNVRVKAPFGMQETWIVEKMLISDKCNEFVSAPTTMISANHLYVPIANPTARPIMIRKSDVVGHLREPQEYLDAPKTAEVLQQWTATADAL